jgi:ABC-type glutathione transport system ATPase component
MSTDRTPGTAPVTGTAGPSADRAGAPDASSGLLARIEHVNAAYGGGEKDFLAVDDVSLDVREGEILGLAGESGSGKTTLGNAIAMIATPPLYVLGGQMRIAGQDVPLSTVDEKASAAVHQPLRGSTVSMLPQGAMNSISPTVRIRNLVVDVVRAHDRNASKDEALDRARDRLKMLSMPVRVLDSYAHQLSGGMKQRAIAVISTLLDPQLLIADEPTSALDVSSQRELIEMLLHLLDQQIIMGGIFVTHDLPVLSQVSDHLAIMHRGQIIERGRTEDLVEGAQEEYTKTLLGAVLDPSEQTRARLFTPNGDRRRGSGGAAAATAETPGPAAPSTTPTTAAARSDSGASDPSTGTAGSPEYVIRCQNVTKQFSVAGSKLTAVDDVSLDFPAGNVLAVVGESGSGKSTLARMMLRLMPVTSGRVIYQDQDVTDIRGKELRQYWRDVQAVFQDPFASFNQFFTVGSTLRRSLKLAQVDGDRADELIAECLGYVDMDPGTTLPKFPHQLSGGQRQRVMVARALMMKPKILLADEATSMLDASLRVNVLNVLDDLRADLDLTVLFITHDIGQACYLADRVAVMEHGRVVERGPSEKVIFDPQADYTRHLLADVPDLHTSLKNR